MAHNKVTIDVEARFIDNLSGKADDAAKAIDDIGKEAKDAQKDLDKLGKSKVKPKVDTDTTPAERKIKDIDRKLDKLGRSKTNIVLKAMDKASTVIGKVMNKGRQLANRTFTAMAKVKDSNAMNTLRKITNAGESLTRKTWRVGVTILDKATAPLRALKNTLFSIKSLVAAITAGLAAKAVIAQPIALADAYSSAKIGFSTLLGEAQGQMMMNDLDAFAKATPFKSSQVISQTQRMLAMGWDAENIIDDMTTIGDAAAATGKGEQGLQQIVTALAQIKTKGRLSTEELNQLAEAGVSAKRYIAEGLGYGTGDEGIAKMTKDLENGAIASEKALQALLGGMKEYQGMMDRTANETVEGLKSQIEDTFEINIMRRWGQGLQDGAKRGFGSIVELLDEADGALDKFGDTVYEIGKSFSNWSADKFGNAVERVLAITDSYDFKEATLGGKVKMLWKGVITDPLKEWWEGGGQEKTAESAGKIGAWMGEAITDGLLALFGVTDVLGDSDMGTKGGMSVAQSFTKGFLDNFDGSAITDAFVDAIGDVWGALPTWAKLLIGGYVGGKTVIGLGNLVSGIGTLMGASATLGAGNVMVGGSGLLGAIGTTGAAGIGASGLLGKLSVAGYGLMGGTSALSVGGGIAALVGAAGAAGGLAGGASAIKGGYDLYKGYKAYKSGDEIEAKARTASGGSALAGVAAGAALGSVIPGVGTAIGALVGGGIGGIAGWFGGNKWADKIREAKYETEEAAEAMKEAETEADKMAALNEAAWESMKRHMGDVKLSASEIERIADQIVWGDDMGNFEKFNSAVQTAEASLQTLKSSAADMDKWMWKASLGVKFNDDEIEAITASFDEYINSAKSYVENKHYEFTAAVSLLVDTKSEGGKAILDSGNEFYSKIEADLDKAGKDLGDTLTKALKDGIISADEQEAITAAQQKIAEITQKISDAEAKAEIELIKVKFGSGKLDLDSFDAFMSQMETTLNKRIAANDEAFKANVSSLNIQLADGAITEEEYNKQLKTIMDGYTGQVDKVKAEIMGVELNIIGDAYEDVLGDDAAAKLQTALEKSLTDGINPIDWSPEQARKYLGIDDLEDDTAKAIATMLGGVADQLEIVEVNGKLMLDLGIETKGDTTEKVKAAVDNSIPESMDKTISLNLVAEKNIQNHVEVLAEEFGIEESEAHTILWRLAGTKTIENKINVLCEEFGINKTEAETILWQLSGQKSIMSTVSLYASDFGIKSSYTYSPTVNISAKLGSVTTPAWKKALNLDGSGYRGGIFGGTSAQSSFARGGLADFPNGGIVGGSTRFIRVNEESPEMIIPLSSQRRDRALQLWEKTGELLDAPGFARGGATNGGSEGIQYKPYDSGKTATADTGGERAVKIEIGNIPITIHVNGDGNIAEAIKAQSAEIAEAVAGVLADELGAIFENTPTKRGA